MLGIGGVRILEALNFNVRKYHMNEGHSSLLTLELLKKNEMNSEKVKNLCVFTTHTPDKSIKGEERRARELEDLYSKLEYVIIPKFYDERENWISMMKNSIGKIAGSQRF